MFKTSDPIGLTITGTPLFTKSVLVIRAWSVAALSEIIRALLERLLLPSQTLALNIVSDARMQGLVWLTTLSSPSRDWRGGSIADWLDMPSNQRVDTPHCRVPTLMRAK